MNPRYRRGSNGSRRESRPAAVAPLPEEVAERPSRRERPTTSPWRERAYRKASWRLALKIAGRTSTRALGRSALIVAMVALPVTGLVAVAVVADSMNSPSVQQRIDTELGKMQARIQVVAPPGSGLRQDPMRPDWFDGSSGDGSLISPEDALPYGTRVLSITSTQVVAKTSTGIGQIDVQEGESWDPSFAGLYALTEGHSPRNDREVLVTEALIPRLGAKIGDTVELRGAVDESNSPVPSVTIVGILKDSTLPTTAQQIYARTGALSTRSVSDDLWSAKFYLPDTIVDWDEVQHLNADGFTVLSRAVLLDPPPNDGSHPMADPWSYVLAFGTIIAVIAGFAAFEVILLAGAAFTVTARQQQRTLATIASVGAPKKLLLRILTANGIVLGVIGGLVGVFFGIGAAAIFMALTADGSATQYYGFHWPWLGFVIAVAFAVLIGWLASLAPARTTSRFDIVSALRGARKPPTATAKRPIVGLIFLLSGIALTLVGGVLAAVLQELGRGMAGGHPLQWFPVVLLVTGPILAQLGLILIGPLLLRGIAKLLGGSGLGARLASRDSARNPGRAVPALAAVMTTVFVAVFGMCFIAGSEASTRDNYQWVMPLGGIRVTLGVQNYGDGSGPPITTMYEHPDAVENAIRSSVDVGDIRTVASVPDWDPATAAANPNDDTPAVILDVPTQDLCPTDPRSPDYTLEASDSMTAAGRSADSDPRCMGWYVTGSAPGLNHIFVGDSAALTIALGHAPSAAAHGALDTGGAVSLYPQYVDENTISISWWSPNQANQLFNEGKEPGKPQRTETLDAVVDAPAHPIYFGVFISSSTADRLGLEYLDSVIIASTTATPTTSQQDALREAMSALPDNNNPNGSGVFANVETGPPDFAGPVVWGLLGLAGLIALASSAIAIGLARFDGRQDDATLSALGAGRVVRRSFAFWQAIIIAGIGSVLGAATGLVPAWALGATGLPFVPPWIPIGIAMVALPLVIACGSWLLASRSKVSARRVAIA